MSAQKALQGSKTETRELLGGMENRSFFHQKGFFDLPSRQINIFFTKCKQKKNVLVAIPDDSSLRMAKIDEMSFERRRLKSSTCFPMWSTLPDNSSSELFVMTLSRVAGLELAFCNQGYA